MKRILYLILLTGFYPAVQLMAQSKDTVLFSVGPTSVTTTEFRYIYQKNNANDKNIWSKQSVNEYLDLYELFKLKVCEAKAERLDTIPKFISEYGSYRLQLAQPYLTDRTVTQELIKEAYDRLKWELRVSHILFPLAADASPKDSLVAWKIAMEVREKIMKGGDFEKLAIENSKDPSVSYNKGDLGYFTAFQLIYPFECGAFALKNIGDVSMPIRTRYGYHLIKLTAKRPYQGEMKARQILVVTSDKYTYPEQDAAKAKADSIYAKLLRGADFGEMAKKYSDDFRTNENGGVMQAFKGTDNLPDEFKNAAFALKKDGDICPPFRSSYGYHIIQRMSVTPLPPLNKEMEDNLKVKIARDSRSDKSRDAAIEKFKKDNNYVANKKTYKKFLKTIDSTLLKGNYKGTGDDKILFTLNGSEKFTTSNFAGFLQKNQAPERYDDIPYAFKNYYTEWVNQSVYNYQEKHLEEKFVDFANISKEYKEGILLFDISDKNVWSVAMTDTVGQLDFYNKNKENYKFGERISAQIISSEKPEIITDIKNRLTKAKPELLNTIVAGYIKKDPLSLIQKGGKYEKGDTALLEKIEWKKGVYELGKIDGSYYLVVVNEIIPATYKKFEDIKGNIISDYQEVLEKKWIADLKQKYPIKLNEEALRTIYRY